MLGSGIKVETVELHKPRRHKPVRRYQPPPEQIRPRLPARQMISPIDPHLALRVELRATPKSMTLLCTLALSMIKEVKFFVRLDSNLVVLHVILPNSTAVPMVLYEPNHFVLQMLFQQLLWPLLPRQLKQQLPPVQQLKRQRPLLWLRRTRTRALLILAMAKYIILPNIPALPMSKGEQFYVWLVILHVEILAIHLRSTAVRMES
jgi:hypothetical protein